MAGIDSAGSEQAFELAWRAAITPWLALQPDYQHIRNPGGTSGTPDAKLIGLRLELAL